MKKKILLVDDSLTVQKVVALTLDKSRYAIFYARAKSELMKVLIENTPDLILVSDQVPDIQASSFPKEVETWLGRTHDLPKFILITGQDLKEQKHYHAVLRKPFAPQLLQTLVSQSVYTSSEQEAAQHEVAGSEGFDDERLQRIFNDAFNDEATLVKQTYELEGETMDEEIILKPARNTQSRFEASPEDSDLWQESPRKANPSYSASNEEPRREKLGAKAPSYSESSGENLWVADTKKKGRPGPEIMGASDSMAYKAVLENQVEGKLDPEKLAEIVDRLLNRIVPPIVERLVQERLDKLLKDHEQFIEMKS